MQQKDIVNQIIDYIPTIDYTKTSTEVSLFETTIRYLGGMVSGYDFLTGPLADLADNVQTPTSPKDNGKLIVTAERQRRCTAKTVYQPSKYPVLRFRDSIWNPLQQPPLCEPLERWRCKRARYSRNPDP
jgi:hypothetical protein